jgi:hypothetical protein
VTSIAVRDVPLHRRSPLEGRRPKRRVARLLIWVGGLSGFVGLVALLYTVSLHNVVGNSDGATVILEGQSMTGGNVMLHGWALSLDSFWTIDALFYMVVEFVTGMREILINLVPAVIAAVTIVVGAWLARDGRRGAPGLVAGLVVVALLGFPSHVLSMFLLQGPLHVGTTLWCLIAFAGLRSGRFGWGWVVAVGMLAAGTLGDFQTVALGIVPVCVAGIVATLRTRSWRTGIPIVSAGLVSLVAAGILRLLASAIGTFTVATSHPTASLPGMVTNVGRVATWGAAMLGVGNGGFANGGVPAPLQAVHVLGLAAVVAGVGAAAISLVRGTITGSSRAEPSATGWRIDDLLIGAFVADLVVIVVLTSGNDLQFMHYLTAATVFGAILAGRLSGRLVAVTRSAPHRRVAGVAGVAVIAALAVGLGFNVTAPAPSRSFTQLGQFLEAHHLHHGIGDYWTASITTVATRGSVTIRPVITTPQGKIVRYGRQSTASWYEHQPFAFLVFNRARPWGGVDAATASATFGPVTRTYRVGTYQVLVWRDRVVVSSVGFSPIPPVPTGSSSQPQ